MTEIQMSSAIASSLANNTTGMRLPGTVVADSASPLADLHRLHLIMGLQCNVRCTMCYQTDFSPKFNMSSELYKDKLLEAYPYVSSVKLQGGEPTIMKNVRETAIILRDYPNAKLTVTTNGVFIDDFWHETFIKQGGCINVSINAATRPVYDKIVIHGEYAKVRQNLERLLANRHGKTPLIGLNAVILKENFNELHKLIELAGDLGVDYLELLVDPILSYIGLPGRDEIQAELLRCHEAVQKTKMQVTGLYDFHQKFALPLAKLPGEHEATKKGACPAPFHNLVIDWDGTARVCCNTWIHLGNLNHQSLTEIWKSKNALLFRDKMNKDNYIWCSPSCSDNMYPTKLSLLNKYWYEFKTNPKEFFRKVHQKIQQVRGRWVKSTKRRTRSLPDPKRPT